MNRTKILFGLGVALVLQLAILAGMLVKAQLPLWYGQEIRLATIPVDPRSMFRGNYALLRYPIAEITTERFSRDNPLRQGEVLYLSLVPTDDGRHRAGDIALTPPGEGPFIRGRLRHADYRENEASLWLHYGIEAYFAPKDKALALEKQLAGGGDALVMLDGSGRAALKAVVPAVNQP